MFNRMEFNKTLFNRLVPLFRDYSEITLFGELRSFEELIGLFQPYFELQGLENITIENYGQIKYLEKLDGSYRLFYDLDGEQVIELISGAEAKYIIELIGQVIKDGKN